MPITISFSILANTVASTNIFISFTTSLWGQKAAIRLSSIVINWSKIACVCIFYRYFSHFLLLVPARSLFSPSLSFFIFDVSFSFSVSLGEIKKKERQRKNERDHCVCICLDSHDMNTLRLFFVFIPDEIYVLLLLLFSLLQFEIYFICFLRQKVENESGCYNKLKKKEKKSKREQQELHRNPY